MRGIRDFDDCGFNERGTSFEVLRMLFAFRYLSWDGVELGWNTPNYGTSRDPISRGVHEHERSRDVTELERFETLLQKSDVILAGDISTISNRIT